MASFRRSIILIIFLLCIQVALAGPRPIVAAEGYQHDKFSTQPRDIVKEYRAYTTSFDSKDNDVALGVPEWVAYEIRKESVGIEKTSKRPSVWFTDKELYDQGVVPNDASYKGSGYSRGHMCMKSLASRLGLDADYNTHTVFNACPQLQGLNAGAWLHLEELTGKWADSYGQVWVICGPVFLREQVVWIGDEGEVKIAVPDAFYKIVIRQLPTSPSPEVLAFVFPHSEASSLRSRISSLIPYLTSVDIVEALTGLDFLTDLGDQVEDSLEREMSTELWPESLSQVEKATIVAEPKSVKRTPKKKDSIPKVNLREGIDASSEEIQIASQLVSLGWEYHMPSPKSSQARWGNTDGRTTWWNGYWINNNTNTISSSQPQGSNGYEGDGKDPRGWRRGGSPRYPTAIEWLCSKSGGVRPR